MPDQQKPKVTIGPDGTIHVDNDNNKPSPKVATSSVKTNAKNVPLKTASKQTSPEQRSTKPLGKVAELILSLILATGLVAVPFGLFTGVLPVTVCGVIAILVVSSIANPSKK